MRIPAQRSAQFIVPEAAIHAGIWMILLMLYIPTTNATSIPHPHRQPKEIVQTIEKLESKWQKAELSANTAVMADMLSDDYLGIYGDGTVATKTETIADFKNGAVKFTEMDTSDRKIRVFGKTVVVVSKAQVTGVNDGENVSGHYRYTRVYHHSNGAWKIVSFEASAIHEHSR